MALDAKNQMLAADFIALKARVKAEMQRRKYTGSISVYAGDEWDFTVQPEAGGKILPEHFNKIVEPINAISPTGLEAVKSGDQAMSIKLAEQKLYEYERHALNGANDCASSCTGLCTTSCGSSCGGNCYAVCENSCNYDCYGTCSSTCADDCTGSCKGTCSSTCSGTCKNTCKTTCTGTCVNDCARTCWSNCLGTCSNSVAVSEY